MLMNNEFVASEASKWAARMRERFADMNARLDDMFLRAYGRLPDAQDRALVREFLARQADAPDLWANLAHVIFNSKEFIFLR